MKKPAFLTLAEVLEIQRVQTERYGGDLTIRDQGLLESALAQPESSFGGEFLDGNKRTGLAAAFVFLAINGVEIEDPKGRLYQAMMDVAARELSKDGLAALLGELAKGR